MRGQFQLSKRAPHPPLRGTFSPWEKGQTTPSFLTFRFRATAFQNRLTGQRCPLWPPGDASPISCYSPASISSAASITYSRLESKLAPGSINTSGVIPVPSRTTMSGR